MWGEERNEDLTTEVFDARNRVATFLAFITNDTNANLIELVDGVRDDKSTVVLKVSPKGWELTVKKPRKAKKSLTKRVISLDEG